MYADIEKRREYNRHYIQDLRLWRKEHHYCVDCGEQDAYTLNGRSRCYECNEKARDRNANMTTTQRQKAADRHQAIREYRREQRLCTTCGAKLPTGYYPFATCQSCRYKSRKSAEQYRRDKGIIPRYNFAMLGLCARCGDPVERGFVDDDGSPRRLCRFCYDHAVEAAAKGREIYLEKYGMAYGKLNSIRI